MNSAAADKQVLFLVRALLVSRNRHSSKLKTMVLNFAPRAQLSVSGDTFIVITRGGERVLATTFRG